jgi:hypothetical protein
VKSCLYPRRCVVQDDRGAHASVSHGARDGDEVIMARDLSIGTYGSLPATSVRGSSCIHQVISTASVTYADRSRSTGKH